MHTRSPRVLRLRALAPALVALLAAACDGSSPTEIPPQGEPRPLPISFILTGSASSTEGDGSTVSCTLDLLFDLAPNPRQRPGVLEYDGVHGGSLSRTVLDAQGNGLSLWPDVHGAVVVRSIAPDRIEIAIPLNETTDSRFWRELALLRGVLAAGDTATGTWNCAPFDIDSGGYVDTRYTAPGSWTLRPRP